MSTKHTRVKLDAGLVQDYDREMLRSAFVSLFWAAIAAKRKRSGFALQSLADALGVDKSAVSRWFRTQPNWTINTIADIACALDLELKVTARDRRTGQVISPAGIVRSKFEASPRAVAKAPTAANRP